MVVVLVLCLKKGTPELKLKLRLRCVILVGAGTRVKYHRQSSQASHRISFSLTTHETRLSLPPGQYSEQELRDQLAAENNVAVSMLPGTQ